MSDVGEAAAEAAAEAPPRKRRRRDVAHSHVYLSNVPSALMYEQSFMHRNDITHAVCHPVGKSEFFLTASVDGHVKIWTKAERGVEFVKHYRAHVGPVAGVAMSENGLWAVTIGFEDRKLKVFDVNSFDLTCASVLPFKPTAVCFAGRATVAISSGSEVHLVSIFPKKSAPVDEGDKPAVVAWAGAWKADSEAEEEVAQATRGPQTVPATVEATLKRHNAAVHCLEYVASRDVVVSTDKKGGIELWHPSPGFPFPSKAGFEFTMKSDTDLFELLKQGTAAYSLVCSLDGVRMACLCADKKLRLFNLVTGRLVRVYDEDVETVIARESELFDLDRLDLGKRVAHDRDLFRSADVWRLRMQFDETGTFLMVPSALGIKVYNVVANRLERIVGRTDASQYRFLSVSLFQGRNTVATKGAVMTSAGDKIKTVSDPVLLALARNKRRFFVFTIREPTEASLQAGTRHSRDVINEILDSDEHNQLLAGGSMELRRARNALIHTTLGDIHIRLFKDETPKTVENFTVHARNNYFDGVLFHRVIQGFMIQTGDPQGDGTGGESIWGQDFDDEFHRELKHDRPYTVSMANAGPNSNGSQFFITCAPTPFLDGKHTVFGRVLSGFEVVHAIENVEIAGGDKPAVDVKILTIRVTA